MHQGNKNSSGPHDDRWHYFDFPDDAHHRNYFEWKYFNFTQGDIEGYIMYSLLDPDGKTGQSGGRLLVRILRGNEVFGTVRKIDINDVEIDPLTASIRMDNAKITEENPHHFVLDADFEDMAWNLEYKQSVPTIESYQNIHTGLARWERLSWLIKIPKAKVTGNIRIGENNFQINALGYSDINWGEVLPYFSSHEWGQYNDDSFTLVFGLLRSWLAPKSAYCYFAIDKKVVSLRDARCEVKHTEWIKDKFIGNKIPKESKFVFAGSEYEVEFHTTLLHYDTPGMIIHPLLPKVFVSEQIVHYKGTVKKNGKLIQSFEGKGFQEWAGKTWKKVAVAF
jgi:hypothetical protein